jgi:predicted nucleotidyltransferase
MRYIEDATKEQLDTLERAFDEFVGFLAAKCGKPELQDLIVDYEICGSYAYGTQRWWSDIDLQLTTEDPEKQKRLIAIITDNLFEFKEESSAMQRRLKIRIEVYFREWKHKQYNECYSLRRRRLYNREPRKPRDVLFKRRWNTGTGRYEEVELPVEPEAETVYWDREGNEINA